MTCCLNWDTFESITLIITAQIPNYTRQQASVDSPRRTRVYGHLRRDGFKLMGTLGSRASPRSLSGPPPNNSGRKEGFVFSSNGCERWRWSQTSPAGSLAWLSRRLTPCGRRTAGRGRKLCVWGKKGESKGRTCSFRGSKGATSPGRTGRRSRRDSLSCLGPGLATGSLLHTLAMGSPQTAPWLPASVSLFVCW